MVWKMWMQARGMTPTLCWAVLLSVYVLPAPVCRAQLSAPFAWLQEVHASSALQCSAAGWSQPGLLRHASQGGRDHAEPAQECIEPQLESLGLGREHLTQQRSPTWP